MVVAAVMAAQDGPHEFDPKARHGQCTQHGMKNDNGTKCNGFECLNSGGAQGVR